MKINGRTFAFQALLIWGAWTLFALFSASQMFMSRAYSGGKPEWKPVLLYALLDCYVWALITPLILLATGYLVMRRGNWWWAVPALLAISAGFALLHLAIFVRCLPWIGYRTNPRMMQNIFMARL